MKTIRILIPRVIILLVVIFSYIALQTGFGQEHEKQEHEATETIQHDESEASQQDHGEESHAIVDEHGEAQAEEHGEGSHGSDMTPLFFVILALNIGAATRHFLRKSPLPYTVTLLLIGLGFGAATRMGWLETWSIGSLHMNVDFLGKAVEWAGHIDPHVILYVFLPTLIFEAAFAMDVHTFRKSVGNASILAIPGIIIALLLTGALAIGLGLAGIGLTGWGWPMALMFGAVVSATDPVAVVSLLKELGASKKLGTLIEGESLLNDGTAIVIFMVFFL